MYIGNDNWYQNVDLLEKIADDMYRKYPKIRFSFVGVSKVSEKNKIFFGNQKKESIHDLAKQADCFVIPREYIQPAQTMPGKFSEYIFAGKPIISTDTADIKYWIKKAHCGYIVKPTIESIKEAILYLYNNPEDKYELGKNTLKLKEEFSYDKIVGDLNESMSK